MLNRESRGGWQRSLPLPDLSRKIEGPLLAGYVVLGPRVKIIILNILPESERSELKFSLKIAFMFLTVNLKWQVPNLNIFLVIRKKVAVLAGP